MYEFLNVYLYTNVILDKSMYVYVEIVVINIIFDFYVKTKHKIEI